MNAISWLNGPVDGNDTAGRARAARDGQLLDAYSQAVVGVVESVELAVVSVEADGDRGGEPRGQGSGFFVTPDGYLLTNDHVVEHIGGRAVVTLSDGRRIQARVIGSDPGNRPRGTARQRIGIAVRRNRRFGIAAPGTTRHRNRQSARLSVDGIGRRDQRHRSRPARAQRAADRQRHPAHGAAQSG